MNELTFSGYAEYKKQVDKVMNGIVEDFVLVGYLLRRAKEYPDILEGSGYADYKEFAAAEYGLEESTVSRFININIKYGDGTALLPEYRGFGRSKLQDMLSLPGQIIEEIPKETPRAEIQEIVKAQKEEADITPIEAAIEAPEYDDTRTLAENFFIAYFRENTTEKTKCKKLYEAKPCDRKKVLFAEFFPAGYGVMKAKVPGRGKYILSVKGEASPPVFTNLRTARKEMSDWDELIGALMDADINIEAERIEPKKEIAPVQEIDEIEKVEGEVIAAEPEPVGERDGEASGIWDAVKRLREAVNEIELAMNEGEMKYVARAAQKAKEAINELLER